MAFRQGSMLGKRAILAMVQQVEARCRPSCLCDGLGLHGIPHLRRVASTAGRLAAAVGEDVEAAVIAGFLHDCARVHDGGGTRHAHDSADLAKEILATFYPHVDSDRLCDGIAHHADGTVTDDPLIGSLWDADRLDLIRLGRETRPHLLSTGLARRVAALRMQFR